MLLTCSVTSHNKLVFPLTCMESAVSEGGSFLVTTGSCSVVVIFSEAVGCSQAVDGRRKVGVDDTGGWLAFLTNSVRKAMCSSIVDW